MNHIDLNQNRRAGTGNASSVHILVKYQSTPYLRSPRAPANTSILTNTIPNSLRNGCFPAVETWMFRREGLAVHYVVYLPLLDLVRSDLPHEDMGVLYLPGVLSAHSTSQMSRSSNYTHTSRHHYKAGRRYASFYQPSRPLLTSLIMES
jgi:hypothetical protein